MRAFLIIAGLCIAYFAGATGTVEAAPEAEGQASDTAFEIEGSEFLYSRDHGFRWTYDNGKLLIRNTGNRVFTVEVLSENVLRVTPSSGGSPRLLFRIGSPEYERMMEFRACVESNRRRKLLEVVDCGNPLTDDADR